MNRLLRDVAASLRREDLVTWTTSIAYSALWTLPPLALLLLALAGFFNLESAWQDHVGPQVKAHLEPDMWRAIDGTVDRIVGSPHVAWVLIGAALAWWHFSAVLRACSGALNSIFGHREARSGRERMLTSLAVAVPVLVLVSVAVLVFVGSALLQWHGVAGVLLFLARWTITASLMWAVLALIIRTAPASQPSARWVSYGAALAIAGWIGASIAFGVYAAFIADFRSPYGNLVTVMVLMAYVYWLSLTFLVGVLVDVELAARSNRGR